MKQKVCVVTGANTGIGKETARGLAGRGATVVLACRDAARGEAARADIAASTGRDDVALLPLDLGDVASIREFVRRFTAAYDRLDVLVNNAGVSMSRRTTTRDGFETTFGVNHLGTFLLTNELVPLLKRSAPSRIVIVSSRLHRRGRIDWDDLQAERKRWSPLGAYRQSKLANILFARALAERLAGTGVTANALHPGVVSTELIRDFPRWVVWIAHQFMITPTEGAACSLLVATAPELEGVSGAYFDKSKRVDPSPAALDAAAGERLWQVSEALLAPHLTPAAKARRVIEDPPVP